MNFKHVCKCKWALDGATCAEGVGGIVSGSLSSAIEQDPSSPLQSKKCKTDTSDKTLDFDLSQSPVVPHQRARFKSMLLANRDVGWGIVLR